MLALPIPLIVAMVLGFLLVRSVGARPLPFLALLTACAAQGLLVSLVLHYGVDALRPLLPVTATTIPPLAWIAFQTALIRAPDPSSDLIHAAAPAFTAFAYAFARGTVDYVVLAIFLGYGAAMILRLLRSAGELPLARLEAGGLPGAIWLALAVALILSAVSDALIAVAYEMGRADLPPLIVSVFSSAALLAIGLLGLSPHAAGAPEPDATPEPPEASEEDAALVARLDALLEGEKLYLEPDLTLARLARRLHVPIKRLSVAINRATGGNVSRHVNGHRIAHACRLLDAGAAVTDAMLESGFNTKSNFNREFARVTGKAPRDWRAAG